MGRRKNKQPLVAIVSVPALEPKMDPVQSTFTFESTFSAEDQSTPMSEEPTNNWFNFQPKMCEVLATPIKPIFNN